MSKLATLKNGSGDKIYINPDQIETVSQHWTNRRHTTIYLSNREGPVIIHRPLEDVLAMLDVQVIDRTDEEGENE